MHWAVVLTLMTSTVFGHAFVDIPTARKPGASSDSLCGAGVSEVLKDDLAAPIENAVKEAGSDYKCNAYVCRGYQYKDNVANLHTYRGGDVVTFHVNLVAGHRPGYANVSIIDPVKNVAIGAPLKTWEAWPVNNPGPDRDDINFNVTIPKTLGSTCAQGGKCAIQWYWWAINNKQTYESCVDFVIGS